MAKKKNFAASIQKNRSSVELSDSIRKMNSEGDFTFRMIPREKIQKSEKNYYPIEEISEMADSISNLGLLHNIVVFGPDSDGNYELLAGERRISGIDLLHERGEEVLRDGIPSRVIPPDTSSEDVRIILNESNAQQRKNLSLDVQLRMYEELKADYEAKAARGDKIEGSILDNVAEKLSTTTRTLRKFEKIQTSLSPELKEMASEGLISVNDAEKYSYLSDKAQEIVHDKLVKNEKVDNEMVSSLKEIDKEEKKKADKIIQMEKQLAKEERLIKKLERDRRRIERLAKKDSEKSAEEIETEREEIEREKQEAEERKKLYEFQVARIKKGKNTAYSLTNVETAADSRKTVLENITEKLNELSRDEEPVELEIRKKLMEQLDDILIKCNELKAKYE